MIKTGVITSKDVAQFDVTETTMEVRGIITGDWIQKKPKHSQKQPIGEDMLKDDKLYRALPNLNRMIWFR